MSSPLKVLIGSLLTKDDKFYRTKWPAVTIAVSATKMQPSLTKDLEHASTESVHSVVVDESPWREGINGEKKSESQEGTLALDMVGSG